MSCTSKVKQQSYCKRAQQTPWTECTNTYTGTWKHLQRKELDTNKAVAHPSSLLLWHAGYGVTQTLLPLTGVGLAL